MPDSIGELTIAYCLAGLHTERGLINCALEGGDATPRIRQVGEVLHLACEVASDTRHDCIHPWWRLGMPSAGRR